MGLVLRSYKFFLFITIMLKVALAPYQVACAKAINYSTQKVDCQKKILKEEGQKDQFSTNKQNCRAPAQVKKNTVATQVDQDKKETSIIVQQSDGLFKWLAIFSLVILFLFGL